MKKDSPIADALTQIAAEGVALESDAPVGALPVDPDQGNAAEWARLPALFGSVLCMALPKLAPAYCQDNCMAWGREMDNVARAYGWNAAEIIAKLGPWPGLILATLPMALPTFAAIKEARAAAGPARPVTVTGPARPAQPGPVDHPAGMLQPVTG